MGFRSTCRPLTSRSHDITTAVLARLLADRGVGVSAAGGGDGGTSVNQKIQVITP